MSERTDTIPRYEIQLCAGGVWCGLFREDGLQQLSPICGFRSLAAALKRVDDLARRDVQWQFDQGIGWAPENDKPTSPSTSPEAAAADGREGEKAVTGTKLDLQDVRHELMWTYLNVMVALQMQLWSLKTREIARALAAALDCIPLESMVDDTFPTKLMLSEGTYKQMRAALAKARTAGILP